MATGFGTLGYLSELNRAYATLPDEPQDRRHLTDMSSMNLESNYHQIKSERLSLHMHSISSLRWWCVLLD